MEDKIRPTTIQTVSSVEIPKLESRRLGTSKSGRLVYYPKPIPPPEVLPLTRTVSNAKSVLSHIPDTMKCGGYDNFFFHLSINQSVIFVKLCNYYLIKDMLVTFLIIMVIVYIIIYSYASFELRVLTLPSLYLHISFDNTLPEFHVL